MNKNKIIYIIAGFLMIVVIVIGYFNLSFSLPTTFKAVVEKNINQDEQLVITNIDTERIDYISIEYYTSSGKREEVKIEDKEVISTLLNNELRIYNGGRLNDNDNEFDLYVHYYGSFHRYTIAEDYIKTYVGNFTVLDDENEVFDYLQSFLVEKVN